MSDGCAYGIESTITTDREAVLTWGLTCCGLSHVIIQATCRELTHGPWTHGPQKMLIKKPKLIDLRASMLIASVAEGFHVCLRNGVKTNCGWRHSLVSLSRSSGYHICRLENAAYGSQSQVLHSFEPGVACENGKNSSIYPAVQWNKN